MMNINDNRLWLVCWCQMAWFQKLITETADLLWFSHTHTHIFLLIFGRKRSPAEWIWQWEWWWLRAEGLKAHSLSENWAMGSSGPAQSSALWYGNWITDQPLINNNFLSLEQQCFVKTRTCFVIDRLKNCENFSYELNYLFCWMHLCTTSFCGLFFFRHV